MRSSPPGPDRWKERSRTYAGIAAAMAAQWGLPANALREPHAGNKDEESLK